MASSSSATDVEEIYFDFRKQCFIYSKEGESFYKLPYPTKETFGYYLKCSGHGSDAKVHAAIEKWGRNVYVAIIIIFSLAFEIVLTCSRDIQLLKIAFDCSLVHLSMNGLMILLLNYMEYQ